ncbi:uncharacterized protein TNCT_332891 [Trichonephila clavata]|uniref:Uncharacterized protein n=1 Tax=Trichonephila clavata TaxID=2740835 RepID=A0A8X6FS82_TRICU|nr:uncharacterized protein TNCT_332891 [Trichonephila clavata]
MKNFLLLVVVLPCIVIADIKCPGGKTFPSSQKSCKVNSEYEGCDLDVEIPEKDGKVYAGMAMKKFLVPGYQNISGIIEIEGECTSTTCEGTCCTEDVCCEYENAECCSSEKCCPSLNTCCNGGCCPHLSTCCGDGCCSSGSQCCNSGCCPSASLCCGEKCCSQGFQCCSGTCCVSTSKCCGSECCSEDEKCCGSFSNKWCCKNSQKCGNSYKTCGAMAFTPAFTSLLMLVAATFVSKSNFF